MKIGTITHTKSVAVPTTCMLSALIPGTDLTRFSPPPKILISCVWADFGVQDPGNSGCHTFFRGMHCKPIAKTVANVTTVKIAIVIHIVSRMRR